MAAFRDALDEKLDLARWAYDELAAEPTLHVYGEPELTTVAFRCHRPGAGAEVEDTASAQLLRGVNAEGRVMLSSTRVDGRFVIRLTVLNHRTDRARVEEAVATVLRHARP